MYLLVYVYLITMKRAILVFCLAAGAGWLVMTQGQFLEPSITFKKINHNFGTIGESDGVVQHRFEFINNGSQPLVILDATTTCGCTIPEWSKQPIQPGASGSILVNFDPVGRPGAFRKIITVKSNARESSVNLYVVGMVNPKPKSLAEQFPIRMGQVRFRSNHMAMMNVVKGRISTDTLGVFNESASPVRISLPNPPSHLSFRVVPEVIEGGSQGVIIGTYDASKIDAWGYQIQKVSVYFNDEEFTQNFIAVSATIGEDFSKMTRQQIENAPRGVLNGDVFNFGDIKPGKEIIHEFILRNEGKDPLIIRDLSATCGCTASEPSRREIPGGEEAVILVTFNSTGKTGRQFHTVTLIMNDPSTPSVMLRIIGNVVN